MAKTESTLKNMFLTLFVTSLVSATALGFVYEATKEPIAKAKQANKISAFKKVLPEFDNDPLAEQITITTAEGDVILYPASNKGIPVAAAVETFSKKGFGGNIKLMVGVLPDGRINGIDVLEHKETPGLGDKIDSAKTSFSQQFLNKDLTTYNLAVRKDGGDVDAITAATISSRAFCDAIKKAYDAYLKNEGAQQ